MKKSLSLIATTILALTFSTSAMAVSCKSFSSQAQAQQYFNAKKSGYKKLDRDRDGIACESNRGGSSGKAMKGAKSKTGKFAKKAKSRKK